MLLFKIFHTKKMIDEVRANPSRFAGDEVRTLLWGILLIPISIAGLGIILFFILGYTDILGFQFGFFKFLFWLSLIVSITFFSIIKRIVRTLSNTVRKETNTVFKTIDSYKKDPASQ